MNAIFQLCGVAGQKVNESVQGAAMSSLALAVQSVPCSHGEIVRDFQLEPGGKSARLMTNITFRADVLPPNKTPAKGTRLELVTAFGETLKLKLWSGNTSSDGLLWNFVAVDENFSA